MCKIRILAVTTEIMKNNKIYKTDFFIVLLMFMIMGEQNRQPQ